MLTRGLPLVRERDIGAGALFLGGTLGWVLAEAGRWHAALPLLQPPATGIFPLLNVPQGLALLAAGRSDEARAAAEHALDATTRRGERGATAWAWWLLATVAAARTPPDRTAAPRAGPGRGARHASTRRPLSPRPRAERTARG